jgi:hypothetical protein
MTYASETLSPLKQKKMETSIGVAIARLLTEKSQDDTLMSSFNEGYYEAKASINKLKTRNKSIDSNSTEFIGNESEMSMQGSVCQREIELSEITYKKMSGFTESDLIESVVDDLSSWVTNS